jgi:hypothetical protein
MQRVDGNAQSPLQLARVDETVDPNFSPDTMTEVIERGSAVHCVSAYEGDVFVLGTDGVFDNLFVDEVVAICNDMLYRPPSQKFRPLDRGMLGETAKKIVSESHSKTQPPHRDCPIGKGGKVDDTSCIVGECVEWTEEHGQAWSDLRRRKWFKDFFTCGGALPMTDNEIVVDDKYDNGARVRNYPTNPNGSFSTYWGSFSEYSGASFNSMRSGWGRARDGDQDLAMYGKRAAMYRQPRAAYGDDDDEDEEEQGCCIM